MGITTIKQGESLPFTFDRDGESITGWVCTIYLKTFPSDDSILSRVIPPTNEAWIDFLTQDETKDLDITHYRLIGKLINSTDDKEEIKTLRFNVAKAWA